MAAKFYINAIQRLKKLNEDNSPTILWSMSSNELKTHSEKYNGFFLNFGWFHLIESEIFFCFKIAK